MRGSEVVNDDLSVRTRYKRANPPLSLQIAQDRLDELDSDHGHIEASLDHKDPDMFGSDEEYDDWRARAVGALGHVKAEQRFLERWIEKNSSPPKPTPQASPSPEPQQLSQPRKGKSKPGQLSPEQAEALERLRRGVEEETQKIREGYQSHYTFEAKPLNKDEGEMRLIFISSIRAQVQAALSSLNEEGARHGFGEKRLKPLKSPLLKLISEMGVETSAIKIAIKEFP